MRISNSILFSAILGISSVGLFSTQAQAITTFADANEPAAFGANISGLTRTTFGFDSSPTGTSALNDGITNPFNGQSISFSDTGGFINTGSANYGIQTSPTFGTTSVSGNQHLAIPVLDGGSGTITFTFGQASTFFGIYLGDQFDSGSASSFRIVTSEGEVILDTYTGDVGNAGTSTIATPSGESLTVGDNLNNFFGATGANPFTSVTLEFDDIAAGNAFQQRIDNFTIDSIVVEATPVPFEFSPAMGLIAVGLGFGGLKLRKAKSNKKDLS